MRKKLCTVLLAVSALLVAGAAMAGVPSAANSIKPACIALVGTTSGVVDPVSQFQVTVNDLANNPVPNVDVVVDFTNCCMAPTDIRVGQVQPFGHAVAGGAGCIPVLTVRQAANGLGVATFRITGAANNAGNSPGKGAGCAQIYAAGVLLGSVTVLAFDQDGVGGVGANDLASWLGDKFAVGGPYFGRSDYDCNASLGANDLSVWLGVKFAAGSTTSGAPYWP